MNTIICPVSIEKVDEKLVRFTALLTFLIALIFIYMPNPLLAAFLVYDFLSRGIGINRASILSLTGRGLKDYIPFRSKIIDKAPKIFAARIGLVLSLLATILLLANAVFASQLVMVVLAFFAFLEWTSGFCMGCYIYSWIVFPYFNKH
ncbi:MAG TPA: DUF4395 domain-containing protein [Prolixibacteraceae bacterium]|jgi:hypothetical protein